MGKDKPNDISSRTSSLLSCVPGARTRLLFMVIILVTFVVLRRCNVLRHLDSTRRALSTTTLGERVFRPLL